MISYDEKLYELTEEWEDLREELMCDRFDYDKFVEVVGKTFNELKPFVFEDALPKQHVELILAMNKFAWCPIGGISDEYDAAYVMTQAMCAQITSGWIFIEENMDDDNSLVVEADDGECVIIDMENIDLSELIEHNKF